MLEHDDGYIFVSKDGKIKEIRLNMNRDLKYKRFIIAHELAHYLLYYSPEDGSFQHRESVRARYTEEKDADYMASYLLMPSKSFRAKFRWLKRLRIDELIAELQICFCVPWEYVKERVQRELRNGSKNE